MLLIDHSAVWEMMQAILCNLVNFWNENKLKNYFMELVIWK